MYICCELLIFCSMLLIRQIYLQTGKLADFISYGYSYNFFFCYLGAIGLFLFFLQGKEVAEPIVEEGQADVIIAFERLEALRYRHFLKKDGVLIANDWRIDPMPVIIGAAEYPENILEDLEKEVTVYSIDATEEAKKLGNSKVSNLVVLGMAARHMDFTKEQWYSVIEHTVPPKTIEVNKAAFDAGYGA